MKFSIDPAILEKINEDFQSAFVVIEGLELKHSEASLSLIKGHLDEMQSKRRSEFQFDPEIEKVVEIQRFSDAIVALGIHKYGVRSSIHNMLNQICVKYKNIDTGLPLVDAYNIFVLDHFIPAGAYDLDRVVGDVEVRYSKKGDKYRQLNNDKYVYVEDGTIVFADKSEVLCNHWVFKQSDTQKIRPMTKNVMMRFEGLGLKEEKMNEVLLNFEKFLQRYFKFKSFDFVILNKENAEGEIKLSKTVEERRERYSDSMELLTRGVSDVIVFEDVLNQLLEGKKLKIKHGVDPTTKDLHLGYAVIYEKLRQFQERGHTIQFLIGSFTARFGDPTDKSEARQMKSKKDVMELAKNYIKQLGRLLNVKKLKIYYNGDWFDKMSAEDMLRIMSEFTVARMLERDMFQKRIKDGKEIGLHEIVYPMLQGYDSVEMESDLTVIGTDQTFNELQARPLQSRRGQTPQNIIAMELLVGTDGKMKMSQSLGNYIGFDDAPEDKFGKIMSIPDNVIYKYFEVCTRVSRAELEAVAQELAAGSNPRDLKMRLAYEIVKIYDGEKAAGKAQEHFVTVFSEGELPPEMPEFALQEAKIGLLDLLVMQNMVSSKGEGRRLIEQGGIKVNDEKISDINVEIKKGNETVIQIGKRKFLKVK